MLYENFIPFELAIKLKDLDFDEPCFGFYHVKITGPNKKENYLNITTVNTQKDFGYQTCSAPTYQQTFKWFRDKHHLFGYPEDIFAYGTLTFSYKINGEKAAYFECMESFDSYEDAQLACLEKLIEIAFRPKEEDYFSDWDDEGLFSPLE